MRVLQYVSVPGIGGLERVVELLAIAQHQQGRDVHVAALLDARTPTPPLLESLRSQGVPLHAEAVPPRGYLRERAVLRSLIHRLGITHVHSHGYRADLISVFSGTDTARVSTVHGYTGGGWKNRAYERIQHWALRRMDAVVAVSQPLASLLERRGFYRPQLQVVVNAWTRVGASTDRHASRAALGIESVQPVIGFVGRLSHEKGADVLVEALGQLQGEKWQAVILGDGPQRPSLVARAKELGISDRVNFRGEVAGAGRFMAAFDLFVLSSRTEGTPMVLFEAMESRVPVIATHVGGVGAVLDEASGLLVPPEDPRVLANAIRSALKEPAESGVRAGRAAERLATQFGPEAWVAGYDAVYQAVANRRHRPPNPGKV